MCIRDSCDFIAVNDCLYCCVALETCISTDVTVFYFIHIRLKLILTEIAVYGLSAIFTFVLNCSCHNTLWVASKTSVFNETGRLSANRRHHLLVIWLLRYHIHYRYGQFLCRTDAIANLLFRWIYFIIWQNKLCLTRCGTCRPVLIVKIVARCMKHY